MAKPLGTDLATLIARNARPLIARSTGGVGLRVRRHGGVITLIADRSRVVVPPEHRALSSGKLGTPDTKGRKGGFARG